jgi:hypothetical protein
LTRTWTDNGPVALPSRTLAYGAGLLVLVFALGGAGLGFQAAFRRNAAPGLDAAPGQRADDALIARPIVDLAPPTAAPPEQKASDDDDDAKADALAAQTAAAQAIQAKTSAAGGNIDDVLASPTEKPLAPTKGPADEAPPGTPVKTDVPF